MTTVGKMVRGAPVSEAAARLEARILGRLQTSGFPTQTYNQLDKPSVIQQSIEFEDLTMAQILELGRDDPRWFGSKVPSGNILFIVMYGNCWRVQSRMSARGTLEDDEACQAIIRSLWRIASPVGIEPNIGPEIDGTHLYDDLWPLFQQRIFDNLPGDWNLAFHVIKDWAEVTLP